MKDISATFLEAESLLRKYGFNSQANEVRKGLAAVQASGAAGYEQLATPQWWVGPDSVADVYLHKDGETFTVGQERDNRALRAALLTIHEEMLKAGIAFDAAARWAGTAR